MSDTSPEISIVVPTYHEQPNLQPLLDRIAATLQPLNRPYEVLIVDDDSRDGTVETAAQLARKHPLRLIVRTENRDLSLAAVEGLRAARGQYLVVMDADLSHPPESIPALIAALQPPTDFALGSRYVQGGTMEQWGGLRWLNSFVATQLARPLAPGVLDPMSGFFALRRETFARCTRLDPIGYKIGLELICRCACRHVAEIPIVFQNRTRGSSKLNLGQIRRYLLHLDRLYRDYAFATGLIVRPILGVGRLLLRIVSLRG
jgi:dolichol-phosphate mannosyltransferase